MDRLFEEFNSLSAVYRKSSELFIKTRGDIIDGDKEDEAALEEARMEKFRQEEEALYNQAQGGESFEFDSSTFGAEAPTGSLIDVGASSAPAPAAAPAAPTFALNPGSVLDPPTFEKTWKSLPPNETLKVTYVGRLLDLKSLDTHFRSHSIKSVAQGGNGPLLRFFLYGQDASSSQFVLCEFSLNIADKTASATIKSVSPSSAKEFKAFFERVLQIS